jgi:putative SOS response-associated peptidase YedK
MCGRFNMTTDPLTRLFMALAGRSMPDGDRLNVAPTETVPVVAAEEGERFVAMMRWWLVPSWAKAPDTRYAMFNARSESMARSPAFRGPFRNRRCVVPVSGFFEWLRDDEGRKQPWLLGPGEDDGLRLAGLWDRWERGEESLESFTIVTTAAAPGLRWLHARQPVILAAEETDAWLAAESDPDHLAALCAPRLAVPLTATPVSTQVNDARYRGPACLEPTGPVRELPPEAADE